MALSRLKADHERGARTAAGSRLSREPLARERMVPGSSPAGASRGLEAPCLPKNALETPSGTAAPNWCANIKPEPGLRVAFKAREARCRGQAWSALTISAVAHASLLAVALSALPGVPELPAGGEAAIPVEMVFVALDTTDAPAAGSGTRQQTASVSAQTPLPQITDDVVPPVQEIMLAQPEPTLPAHIEGAEKPTPIAEAVESAPVVPDAPVALAAGEARQPERLQEQRENQRQAPQRVQITERRKQQAQRAALDAKQIATGGKTETGPGEVGRGIENTTRQARQTGSRTQGAAASAGTAEIASYRSRILAHLARYKTYPETAQEAGIQGRATVSFTITRTGSVTTASLAGSSGVGVLDQATLAMVRRAQPFPAMPAGAAASMSFTAVIRYDLR